LVSFETSQWCGTYDFSTSLGTDFIGHVFCWYVVSCQTIVGFAEGSTCFKFGMEINWFRNSWSM